MNFPKTMKAIQISEYGAADSLQLSNVPLPSLGADELLVQVHAVGVNFVDTQHRCGNPFQLNLPAIIGIEAAGDVVEIGQNVEPSELGKRVGIAGHMGGNYGQFATVPANRAIPLPNNVSYEQAAASLITGMTAHFLTHDAYEIRPNDLVLVHAAAGGVGLMLTQMAKMRGATVIGTCSSDEKAMMAQQMGADHVVNYTTHDFTSEVQRITEGEGVHAIYDGVGRATFDKGITVLRTCGSMVVYGLASGNVSPFDINRLSGITGTNNRGSLRLTWATLNDYAADRKNQLYHANDVLTWVGDGSIQVYISGILPLHEAGKAHELVENRRTIGKLLLIPPKVSAE